MAMMDAERSASHHADEIYEWAQEIQRARAAGRGYKK